MIASGMRIPCSPDLGCAHEHGSCHRRRACGDAEMQHADSISSAMSCAPLFDGTTRSSSGTNSEAAPSRGPAQRLPAHCQPPPRMRPIPRNDNPDGSVERDQPCPASTEVTSPQSPLSRLR